MRLADRRELGRLRLAALGLDPPPADRSPLGIVRALGAMQAQDLTSGLWSLGVRTGGTLDEVVAAVDRGEITRTWPMRGTLHWVPAVDAGWMCALLSGPSQRAAERVLAREGLTPAIVERAGSLWAEHLADGSAMTRGDAAEVLSRNGIDSTGQRCYHLLVRQSQTGLLVQGALRRTASGGWEPTFVRADRWIQEPHRPGREEAMALLVERYVRSHGPVTERDVAGWCDQTLGFVREAVALTDGRVQATRVGETAYLVPDEAAASGAPRAAATAATVATAAAPPTAVAALLLPGYDEWMLGYKDRSAQLAPGQLDLVVPGGNGVFRGTVVAGSVVVGTWGRTAAPGGITVAVEPFAPFGARVRAALERAGAAYGRFWGRPVRVVIGG